MKEINGKLIVTARVSDAVAEAYRRGAREQRAEQIVDALKQAHLDASEQTVLTIASTLRCSYADAAAYVIAHGLEVFA